MPSRTARLSRLLRDARPERATVAFSPGGRFTRADLAERVAAVAAELGAADGTRWLVHTDDAFASAVSLLALWGSGAVALLSPNRQPATLARLAAEVDGALLDGPAPGLPAGLPCIDPVRASHADLSLARTLDPGARVAEFRTSGTTGDEKAVAKTLRHLEDEVETLEALFGEALPADARIFATVSPQHIYGLLFRVLWPLASGRPFQSETLLHPQELVPRMSATTACALVTTPAHLRRMAAVGGLRELRGTCLAVFSSGAPLDPETAKGVADQLGEAPREILGSTETGGVAVRQRTVHGESWSPFPGVDVERDGEGRLVVVSPFASEGEVRGERRRFVMGDRVLLREGGGFVLGDRADRTVKVGGVRLSLPAMERDLEAHPWVHEAALVVLEQASEGRVHAVVVPSDAGRVVLREQGRRALGAGLAAHLAARFDRVLLPRAWRAVDALPRNAQGKLPAAALRALFDTPRRDPVTLSETHGERLLERRLEVPADLAALEGHFEGMPLVPGVVQLGWALAAGACLLGRPPRVRGIEALKFPTLLVPGDRLTLRVEISEAGDRLRFRLSDGERVFATGRCVLAAGGDDR
jgi:acyl-coenzyme A synthetase/AMP-(fatty) acid ligase/3-hydroxymyristoyl/3-hydroxydecanoyl-(acyl carrier protein) dehydratase